MIVIKMMSGENLADSDVAKGYSMTVVGDGGNFEFGHDVSGAPIVSVTTHQYGYPETVVYPLAGKAYVVSESGKTIASFWGGSKTQPTGEPNTYCTGIDNRGGICLEKFKDPTQLESKELPKDFSETLKNAQTTIAESNDQPGLKGGRELSISLDPGDPDPVSTVTAIKEIFPIGVEGYNERLAEVTLKYTDSKLTKVQLMLLAEPRLPLSIRPDARDKAYRARTAYLMHHGIPQEIAMEHSIYLLG